MSPHRHDIFTGKKSRNKNVYSAESRVVCSNRVAHFLENLRDGMEVQNKVHRPQLPILAYKHLRFEEFVKVVDVDQTEARRCVPFICKNSRGVDNG